MSQIYEKLLCERSIGKSSTVKITSPSEEQSDKRSYLIVEKQGTTIFKGDIEDINVKDSSAQPIKNRGKQVGEMIANEETQITLTEEGELWIRLKDRQIHIQIVSDKKNLEVGGKKEVADTESRILKLEEIVKRQDEILLLTKVNYDSVISKLVEDIIKLKIDLSNTKEELSITKLSISSVQTELSSLQNTLSPLIAQQEEFHCFHHPYNPHSHHFTLRFSPHCLRIIKTSDNTFHNFISSLPILANKVTTFKIRQVRVIDGEVFIGVGTKSVFGDINSWNRDFLSYYSGDGDVCENGLYHQGGQQIKDGETVTLRVDLLYQIVSWWMEGKQLAQAKIPEQMLGRQLYLVLLMKHKGDELDLLIDQEQ